MNDFRLRNLIEFFKIKPSDFEKLMLCLFNKKNYVFIETKDEFFELLQSDIIYNKVYMFSIRKKGKKICITFELSECYELQRLSKAELL